MWIFDDFRRCGAGCVVLLSMLTGCGARESEAPATTNTSIQATPIQTTVATTTGTGQRLEKWIDLQVGECLADPPPTDPGVVLVSVVDCAIPHAAEVYLRADLEVNAAIADVADRQCSAGLTKYTGQSIGPLAMTYLIDSNQDRTSTDPRPSTVICLLQAPNGGPLTGSARR